jgi:hypothetical protein|tara:strand:- start:485 stop:1039 length:555 start_codon:yes stop_codon:yes gene_type:complete
VIFDPHASWSALRERADATENPLHKKLLDGVANHMEAEINARLKPLMATLTDHPIYHFWQVGPENMVLEGYDAVAGFYQNMFSTNGQQFQVVSNRIIVDDNGVITEGQVRQVYAREALLQMGVLESRGQPIDSQPLWLSNTQLLTIWPNAGDGRLLGEDIYFGEDPMTTLSPINEEALPDYFIR